MEYIQYGILVNGSATNFRNSIWLVCSLNLVSMLYRLLVISLMIGSFLILSGRHKLRLIKTYEKAHLINKIFTDLQSSWNPK